MPSGNGEFTRQATLPSNLEAYHALIEEIVAELERRGWATGDLFAIRMALEESISNAVRHGNKHDPAKQVHVDCRCSDRRFWVEVRDEGPGFCPEKVPDCCAEDRLECPGGRGLALMRAFMTRMEYNDRGNVLTMEKVR